MGKGQVYAEQEALHVKNSISVALCLFFFTAQYKNASLLFKSYRAEIESCIPDAIQLCIKLYPHGLVSEEVLEKLINDCSSCDRDGDRKFLIDHICTQIDNNPAVLERFLAVFQEEAGIAELKFCTLSGLAKKIEKRMSKCEL